MSVSTKKGNKERPDGLHRNRRARATLRDKGGSSFCQGQGGVAWVSPS